MSPPTLWLQSWFTLIGKLWSELSRRWDARFHLQAWGPFPEETYFSIASPLMDQLLLVPDYSKNQSPCGVRRNGKHTLIILHTSTTRKEAESAYCAFPGLGLVWSPLFSVSTRVSESASSRAGPPTHSRLRQNQHVHSPLVSKMGKWMLLVCHPQETGKR